MRNEKVEYEEKISDQAHRITQISDELSSKIKEMKEVKKGKTSLLELKI
jgi:hypothetical protein